MGFVRFILFLFLLLCSRESYVQAQDTIRKDSIMEDSLSMYNANSIVKVPDSILNRKFVSFYSGIKTGIGSDTILLKSSLKERLLKDKKLGFDKLGILLIDKEHTIIKRETTFYVLLGIVILLTLVMYFFDDYFLSFLQSFTNPSYRLSLTNENYALGYFPSFLLNILFALTGGIFIAILTQNYISNLGFWKLCGVWAIILALIYLIKFLVIKFSGILFNAPASARLYTQIVFNVNKLIGILLIPLLWVILFSKNPETDILVKNLYTIFAVLFFILLIYRYFVSFIMIKNRIKANIFHFFIYLCAVEILPVLILLKFMTEYINRVS